MISLHDHKTSMNEKPKPRSMRDEESSRRRADFLPFKNVTAFLHLSLFFGMVAKQVAAFGAVRLIHCHTLGAMALFPVHVVAQWRNGLKLKTATNVPTVDASGSAASITGRLRVGDDFPKGSMQLRRERHYEI